MFEVAFDEFPSLILIHVKRLQAPRKLFQVFLRSVISQVCHYQIAASWPQSIDDTVARKDWGWKEEFALSSMVKDMFDNL